MDKKPSKRFRQKQFIQLYVDDPSITNCCKDLAMQRSTFYRWYEKDEKFKKEFDQLLDTRKVLAKSAIVEILNDPKHPDRFKCAKMILSKDDQWSDQENVNNNVNGQLQVKVNFVESKEAPPNLED